MLNAPQFKNRQTFSEGKSASWRSEYVSEAKGKLRGS